MIFYKSKIYFELKISVLLNMNKYDILYSNFNVLVSLLMQIFVNINPFVLFIAL